MTLAGRIGVGLVAAIVLAATGVGWSLDTTGTSNAVAAAGDVGVVQPSVLAAASGAATASSGAPQDAAATASGAPVVTDQSTAPPVPAVGAENILLVGADSRTDAQGNALTAEQQAEIGVPLDGGGVNTDTLLIVHIPAGGGQATAVSIPRDTWMGSAVVDAPGVTGPDQSGNQVHYRPGKINGFYGTAKYYDEQYLASKGVTGAALQRQSDEAGRTTLIRVIQQFTGIKINHYAEVNLLGFYLMSQALGGVTVCLLHSTKDPLSGADFHAGYQTVEGKSALAFVRQRHGLPGSDLDRIKRQQAFLSSALDEVLSVGTLTSPSRLSALLDAVHRSVVMDSGFDLLTFAEQMRGLAAGSVQFATVPTTDATDITSTDALQADPTEVRTLFAALAADRPLPAAARAGGVTTPESSVSALHHTVGDEAGTTRPASDHSTVHHADNADNISTAAVAAGTDTTAATAGGSTKYQIPCVN